MRKWLISTPSFGGVIVTLVQADTHLDAIQMGIMQLEEQVEFPLNWEDVMVLEVSQ